MMDPWLGFVNEQVARRDQSGATLESARLRQSILDRSASSFPFPLAVSFRGVVTGRREHASRSYLVVEPAKLCEQALEALGGVLLPTDRGLRQGSVVEVRCRLADPDTYWMDEGVLARDAEIDAIVPIEP